MHAGIQNLYYMHTFLHRGIQEQDLINNIIGLNLMWIRHHYVI